MELWSSLINQSGQYVVFTRL